MGIPVASAMAGPVVPSGFEEFDIGVLVLSTKMYAIVPNGGTKGLSDPYEGGGIARRNVIYLTQTKSLL